MDVRKGQFELREREGLLVRQHLREGEGANVRMSSTTPPTVRALWTVAVVNRFALRSLARVDRGECLGAVLGCGYGGNGMIAH
jgi:hypothetical protein